MVTAVLRQHVLQWSTSRCKHQVAGGSPHPGSSCGAPSVGASQQWPWLQSVHVVDIYLGKIKNLPYPYTAWTLSPLIFLNGWMNRFSNVLHVVVHIQHCDSTSGIFCGSSINRTNIKGPSPNVHVSSQINNVNLASDPLPPPHSN